MWQEAGAEVNDRVEAGAGVKDACAAVIAENPGAPSRRQLYDAVLEIYPDRVNPGSLWGAANAAKKSAS